MAVDAGGTGGGDGGGVGGVVVAIEAFGAIGCGCFCCGMSGMAGGAGEIRAFEAFATAKHLELLAVDVRFGGRCFKAGIIKMGQGIPGDERKKGTLGFPVVS